MNDDGVKYRDVFHQSEKDFSAYNFEHANIENLLKMFDMIEKEAKSLVEKKISLPAYDQCLKASHIFNILDARGAIDVTRRGVYIGRIRAITEAAAGVGLDSQDSKSEYFLELFSREIHSSLQKNVREDLVNDFVKIFTENSI